MRRKGGEEAAGKENRGLQLITIQTECLWGRRREQSRCNSNNPRLESVRANRAVKKAQL